MKPINRLAVPTRENISQEKKYLYRHEKKNSARNENKLKLLKFNENDDEEKKIQKIDALGLRRKKG